MLEGLCQIALADGVFHAKEEKFLADVARLFGFTDAEFFAVKAREMSSGADNPYEVLGVAPEIDDEALKIHYRKLMADYDPDTMIARGVPPEFVSSATKKIGALNAAYESVARQRKLTL